MDVSINQRFAEVIERCINDGFAKNKADFGNKINVGASRISEIIGCRMGISSEICKSLYDIFKISPDWLITGQGDMLKKGDTVGSTPELPPNINGIPLIPIEAMAGYGEGEMEVMEYDCVRYDVPLFKGADFLIAVKGSSMYPKYSSGDIVACKKLPVDTFFQWNKVYVLDTVQGALIKRVKRGCDADHLLIVSENDRYEPFELHRSQIRSVAIVIGVIRVE